MFHVPRAFKVQPDPGKTRIFNQPFRWSPQMPFGRPDWDLILRTFFDVGRTLDTRRLSIEQDETLASWGVGAELQFTQHLSLRLDWGLALKDTRDGQAQAGDSRFHFVGTIMW